MNNLEQLIRCLTEEESRQLSKLNLSPCERRYLRQTIADVHKSPEARNNISKDLTKFHAYKIRSILSNQILTLLAGSNELDKLFFLQSKRLRSQFIRYLPIVEKKMAPVLKGNEREYFYKRLFNLSMPWDFESINEPLIREYATKYAQARVIPLPHEELLIEAYILLYRVVPSDSRPQEQTIVLKKLKALYRELKDSPHIEARVTVLRGMFECYLRYIRSIKDAIKTNEELLDIISKDTKYHTLRNQWMLRLERARMFILLGENENGYVKFKELFTNPPPKNRGSGFHEMIYFQACLYTKRFDEAEEMIRLEKLNKGPLAVLHPSDLRICLIMFYLLSKNIQEGIQQINFYLQREHEVALSFYHELLLRGFEVYCHIFLGDYRYAEALIKRHLKFAEYNVKKVPTTIVPRFLRLANAIIAERQQIKPLQAHHLKKIDAFRTEPETEEGYCLYLLLQQMREGK